jgi:hypothetical protein
VVVALVAVVVLETVEVSAEGEGIEEAKAVRDKVVLGRGVWS